jgi:chlorobactene glucosyltransferase
MNVSILVWLLPTVIGGGFLYILVRNARMWRFKNILSDVCSAIFIVAGLFLATVPWPLEPLLVAGFLQLLLLVLALRIRFGRLDARFLQRSTYLSLRLTGILLGICVLSLLVPNQFILWAIVLISFVVAALFLYQALWTLRHFAPWTSHKFSLKELPTVTLAIPARNETHALTDCLAAAVASDYPKLEIIVLDDCSQDTTSALIRSFAQDGVRFVQGSQPASGWLGKNQAFQTLFEQATGEYILFAGVDTHVEPQSISRIVQYCVAKNMNMVSVLPQRRDFGFGTFLWQLRYFWQVVFPITRHRVPIASQAWMIKADVLQQLGGFAAVRNKITPEGSFARQLYSKDTYRFVVSDQHLGFTTAKRFTSQIESALRFLYPTFKRQPFFTLGAVCFIAMFLSLPFIVLQVAAPLAIVGLFAMLGLLLSYLLVIARVIPYAWPLTLLLFPVSLIQEAILVVASMLLYEFGEVNWKGRNVCYPVITSNSSKDS